MYPDVYAKGEETTLGSRVLYTETLFREGSSDGED